MGSISRFTSDQMQALDRYFGAPNRDWNRIPSHSFIWKNCLNVLKEQCQLHTQVSSPVRAIARKSLPLLQQKSAEDLRRFFCDHLIIGVQEIPQRVERFISKMEINQQGQYICLVLSNPAASIYCDLQIKGVPHPKEMDVLVTVDLLVEETVSTKALFQKHKDTSFLRHSETLRARCAAQVPIPRYTYAVWKNIDSTIKRVFFAKLKEISKRILLNKERERTNRLWRCALLASALLAVFAFLRARRHN